MELSQKRKRVKVFEKELTEDYIRQNADKVNWNFISKNIENYSDEFIRYFEGDFNWHIVSNIYFEGGSSRILNNFEHKLNWEDVYSSSFLTEEQIRSRLPQTNNEWHLLSCEQQLSELFIYEFIDKFSLEEIIINQTITEKFIRDNMHRFDEGCWFHVSIRATSEQFVVEFKDKLDTYALSAFSKISIEFLDSINKIDWKAVSSGRKLNLKGIKKYSEKIFWDLLAGNPFVLDYMFFENDYVTKEEADALKKKYLKEKRKLKS